jgi:hypothetical protein
MGYYDGHDNAPVRCRAHRPTKNIQGYPRCHWTPPSGNFLPRIASADAMVINFGVKNELWHCGIAFRS